MGDRPRVAAKAPFQLVRPPSVEGSDFRTGGETIGDAEVIPALPFFDSGNTCGHINDYDEICPYSGSDAPDVVYEYSPQNDVTIMRIDLCASLYDTKVYVYEAPDFDEPIACNDDASCGYSGYQSRIPEVCLYGGSTYYIVIDGYGSSCGEYQLDLAEYAPCLVECPPGSLPENEPSCEDGYVDHFNGGCGSDPPVFQSLEAQSQGCANLCGRSCAYTTGGELRYDEDWYEITAVGGESHPVVFEVQTEFSCVISALAGTCQDPVLIEARDLGPCEPGTISFPAQPGQRFMLGIRSTDPGGGCYPFGEYVLQVCGIQDGPTSDIAVPPDPFIQASSWGRIKARYRE